VLDARNGAEALDAAARAGRVDLVVSDIMMPVMKGPELATRLRDRFPDIQVILVSGFVVTDDVGPGARVMQKPFAREDLVRQVQEAIGPPKQAS
jgi:two-component system, cell cycle sensor histidine kinase and response regulator CckA